MLLNVPQKFQRNSRGVMDIGVEKTGAASLDYVTRLLDLDSLAETDILDIGCGVRFAQTIVNLDIPIKSYTGVELYAPLVDFLNQELASRDRRFEFLFWDALNQHYNPGGRSLESFDRLPTSKTFDVIWSWSVLTHQFPDDSLRILKLMRQNVREKGSLFFSAFVDEGMGGFEDRVEGKPLVNAYYGKTLMDSLVEKSGWKIRRFFRPNPKAYVQHHYLCSPA